MSKVSFITRSVRAFGVLTGISVGVITAITVPLVTYVYGWNFIHNALGGRYPDFDLPDDISAWEPIRLLAWRGAPLPSKIDLSWVIEVSISLSIILFLLLIIVHTLTPMKKRIRNTLGTTPYKVERTSTFQALADELSDISGGPRASIWILPIDGIQAYALSGPLSGHAIIISRGSLRQLDTKIVQWIICHEYAHILHGDTRSSSLWVLAMRSARLLDSLRNKAARITLEFIQVIPLLVLLTAPLLFVFRLFALIGSMGMRVGSSIFLLFDTWASRRMEFAADQFATIKIGPQPGVTLFSSLTGELEPRFNGLFATHPSMSDRIDKITEFSHPMTK